MKPEHIIKAIKITCKAELDETNPQDMKILQVLRGIVARAERYEANE